VTIEYLLKLSKYLSSELAKDMLIEILQDNYNKIKFIISKFFLFQ